MPDPIKQYVNLNAQEDDKTRGNKPTLEAVPKSSKKFWQKKREVEWKVEPEGTGNVDLKYLSRAQRAQVKEAKTKEADGKFSNELTLPQVGKDKYKVTVTKVAKKESDRASLKEIQFETWRKIYYTVWVMNDECDRIFTAVKDRFHAAFEPCGIELEMVEKLRCKQDETYTVMTDNNDEYDLPWVYPDGTSPVAHAPFHMKIVVLNNLREKKERNYCVEIDREKVKDWEADTDRYVEDLDKDQRPASKGKTKAAALAKPSKLTPQQVRKLQAPPTGYVCELSDGGALTKGGSFNKAAKVVWAKTKWAALQETSKTVEEINGGNPGVGTTYKLSDGGTLAKGNLGVSSGDLVVYEGSKFVKCAASAGSFRVADLNDPQPKPAGVTDEVLDKLMAPADGDAWECEDDGRLNNNALEVKAGDLVKWKASTKKWELHRGRWVIHIKPGHPLAPTGDEWKPANGLYLVAGAGGTSALDKAHWEKVDEENLKIKAYEDAGLNAAIDRGKTVKVQPKLGLMVDNCCGYSIGNFVVVRTAEDASRLESCILQTFTHEIGHGLQQVKKKNKLYNVDSGSSSGEEDNALWHTDDKGGQGDHCSFNAKEIDSTKTTSGKTYEHDSTKGKLCTLFFRDDNQVEGDGKFCATCAENLRRTPLDADTMDDQGWNWFP